MNIKPQPNDGIWDRIKSLLKNSAWWVDLYNKSFTIVIYDRNDSTIIWPVLKNYKLDWKPCSKP
jgi:hypothetical protein